MTPALRAAFQAQADACLALGSPFMHHMLPLALDAVPAGSALAQRLLDWPEDRLTAQHDAIPLRLAGALHANALQGNAPLADVFGQASLDASALTQALNAAYQSHEAHILAWLDRPPQTNEVRRSAALIAVSHWLTARFGKMMVVSEIGASAGLNLNFDFYRMDAAGAVYGPAESHVRLAPDWRGLQLAPCPPYLHDTRGVDLNPLNPADPDDHLRLLAYIWPDQQDRQALTKAAIRIANAPDVEAQDQVDRADALDWLPGRLGHQTPFLHLLFSTVAWQYLPAAAQAKGQAIINAAGARATLATPLAWFRMEADGQSPGAGMHLRLWPGNFDVPMGRIDFHGRWIDWQAPPPDFA